MQKINIATVMVHGGSYKRLKLNSALTNIPFNSLDIPRINRIIYHSLTIPFGRTTDITKTMVKLINIHDRNIKISTNFIKVLHHVDTPNIILEKTLGVLRVDTVAKNEDEKQKIINHDRVTTYITMMLPF
jgi:hypothetical protein